MTTPGTVLTNTVSLDNVTGNYGNATTEDYIYDYDASVNNVPLDELVPNALGYGLTLILGLVGNTLVIVSVARYRRMQNVTNIFLLSLASADLLLVLICLPVKVTLSCNISFLYMYLPRKLRFLSSY